MKIGIAILGVGRWGVHWVRHFQHHPQATIVALVDPDPVTLKRCQQQYALDPNWVTLATDWSVIAGLDGLHAVVVATPATTHYPIIAAALAQGYHVLAEKPLTLDPQECIELAQSAHQKKRQLLVDHTYLFHPAVERGQQVIAAQHLGELRYGYASRTHLGPVRQDVDALWDLAIHDIAIFNHWLGALPCQVQAFGQTWLQAQNTMAFPQLPVTSGLEDLGLADLVWLTLTYPNGFQAQIHLCWLNPDKQRRLAMVGTQGTLIFDELALSPLTVRRGYFQRVDQRFLPSGIEAETISVEPLEPLQRICDRFITNILEDRLEEVSSGWTAANLVQILLGASHSLQQNGRAISLPKPFIPQ